MPLPPYITRPNGNRDSDKEDYQTMFAEHRGAVAAPTAGLKMDEKEGLDNVDAAHSASGPLRRPGGRAVTAASDSAHTQGWVGGDDETNDGRLGRRTSPGDSKHTLKTHTTEHGSSGVRQTTGHASSTQTEQY